MVTTQNLTLQQAATRLGISVATLKQWATDGHIGYVTTPRGHRQYPPAEVERVRRAKEPWQRWSTVSTAR